MLELVHWRIFVHGMMEGLLLSRQIRQPNLFIITFYALYIQFSLSFLSNRAGFLFVGLFLFYRSGFNLFNWVSNHNWQSCLLVGNSYWSSSRVPIKIFFLTYRKTKYAITLELFLRIVLVFFNCSFVFFLLVCAFPQQIWVCTSVCWTLVKANHSSGRNVNFSFFGQRCNVYCIRLKQLKLEVLR